MAADVEALLIGWLSPALGVRCVTDLPANLQSVLPIIRVTRSGGGESLPTFEEPIVDVDCFATDRAGASLLARRAHDALTLRLPGFTAAGAVVCRVDTLTGPSWRPYDDSSLRRFGADYSLTVKSPALTS